MRTRESRGLSPYNPLSVADERMKAFRVGQTVRTTGKGRTAAWIEKGQTAPTVYFGKVTRMGIRSIFVTWESFIVPGRAPQALDTPVEDQADLAEVEPVK